MKVVLRQDVDHLGERGNVVNVADGFARNYLFPKKLALEATPGNLRTFELHKKVWAAREARETGDAEALAGRLSRLRLTVTKKAGEQDTLFGSVTNTEIAELLAKEGFEVDRRKILLDEPIKSLGEHPIRVRVHRQVVATIPLHVLPEGE